MISLILCETVSASVYIEGDIETRVYNDSINGEVKMFQKYVFDAMVFQHILFFFYFLFNVSLKLVEH